MARRILLERDDSIDKPRQYYYAFELADMVLKMAEKLDTYVAALFPVFDILDHEFRNSKASMVWDGEKFRLLDANGKCLAFGNTFKEFMGDVTKRLGS